MVNKASRAEIREKKHRRLRHHLNGTATTPRLAVFRSNKHIYAQIIDDVNGNTLVACSTKEKAVAALLGEKNKSEQAKVVGIELAKKATAKGIEEVVFDRGGYLYHGRVSELAEGAREGGLKF